MEPPLGGGGGGAARPGVRRLALPTSPFSELLMFRGDRPFMGESVLDDREGDSDDREDELLLPAASKATRQSSASGMLTAAGDSAANRNIRHTCHVAFLHALLRTNRVKKVALSHSVPVESRELTGVINRRNRRTRFVQAQCLRQFR